MDKLRKAILGTGNRSLSIIGACLLIGGITHWLATGEFDMEAMMAAGAGLIGMLARGGGTGSDAPAP
jgi:hypothetical protein